MINKLYIKNSIKNNFAGYINIILIIIVSIMIINILNIYVDSVIHGSSIYGIEVSKGYNIWIENSNENDLSYFKNIPNTEMKYEDNIIYVKILNEHESDKVRYTINNIIKENKLDFTTHSFSNMLNGKDVPDEYILLFNILKIIFLFIGTISIYFIYMMFIEKKKKDLGILISLGMSDKQLKKLLLTELFIIYIISFVSAFLVSNVLMYILIKNFLFTENRNFILIIYKFSIQSTVFLLFVSAVSIFTAFYLAFKKISSRSVIDTIQRNNTNININRMINVWNKSSASRYIAKANLLRNRKHFIICFVISVISICVITVFFNFINLLLNPPGIRADFTVVNHDIETYEHSEIVLENIENLKKVIGIKKIEYNTQFNNFLVEKNESKLKFPVYIVYTESGKIECHHISIIVLSDEQFAEYKNDNGSNNIELDNHILLPKNIPYSKYETGDEIFLYKSINSKKESLTIAGFIDVPQNGNFLYIYVTKDNFEKIVGKPAIPNGIYIFIDNTADISKVREDINNIFNDEDLFSIIDNIQIRQDGEIVYRGLQIIIVFLRSVLAICAFILLWTFITFYISNQKPQTNILEMIGAAKKIIRNIAIYEALAKGTINSLAGLSIGTCVSYIVIKMSTFNLLINAYFFIVYGFIIIITILAHIIPSYITIRKIIDKNIKTEENE